MCFFLMIPSPTNTTRTVTLFPYTPLFRPARGCGHCRSSLAPTYEQPGPAGPIQSTIEKLGADPDSTWVAKQLRACRAPVSSLIHWNTTNANDERDRKSTRLNSSH